MKVFPYGPWADAPTGALNFAKLRLLFQNPEAYRLYALNANPEILTDCRRELLMVLLSAKAQVDQVFGVLDFDSRRGGAYDKAATEVLASGRCPLLAKDLERAKAMAARASATLAHLYVGQAELVAYQRPCGNHVLADVALRAGNAMLTVKIRSLAQAARELQYGTWGLEAQFLAQLGDDSPQAMILVVEPDAPYRAVVVRMRTGDRQAKLQTMLANLDSQRAAQTPALLTEDEFQSWARDSLLAGGDED